MAAEQYILCILVAACQTLNDKGLEECRNKTARYGSIVIVFGRRSDDRGLIHERVHYAPDHLVKKTSTSTLPNFLLLK